MASKRVTQTDPAASITAKSVARFLPSSWILSNSCTETLNTAALDGVYVIRTSLSAADCGRSYKALTPAEPSASARRKKATRKAEDGTPAHSFRTLLEDLAPVACNDCRSKSEQGPQPCDFELDTHVTAEQTHAMELLKEIEI